MLPSAARNSVLPLNLFNGWSTSQESAIGSESMIVLKLTVWYQLNGVWRRRVSTVSSFSILTVTAL